MLLQPNADPGDAADANGAGLGVSATGNVERQSREGGDEIGSGGGNRWPKEETHELLQIRSDMDGVFREASQKGPLWDEVSRKMAEKGFSRSAKKCREKFENVYKYHRRTKDGRSSKSDRKTYRFFDQLEALQSIHPSSSTSADPIAMAMPPPRQPPHPPLAPTQPPPQFTVITTSVPLPSFDFTRPTPSSSSTSSDEEILMKVRSKRKRKMKEFFQKLTEDVMKKQDELHNKFMAEIERRENEHRIREESWKANEITRLNKQHAILIRERSIASAKEAALISYIQKLTDQNQIPPLPAAILLPQPPTTPTFLSPPISKPPAPDPALAPAPETAQIQDNRVAAAASPRESRWPKEEIEALIKLRANMDQKYQQEGIAKGALWEEISGSMKTMGYNRNAKRCKEKWENINKYYRRVKEKNKKPRVDSKTCPYYYQLEALYAGANPPAPVTVEQDEEGGDYDDEEDGGYEISARATAAMEVLLNEISEGNRK